MKQCNITQGVLQRSVAMSASVSGSLAEVRIARALLLLVDDMAFDTIADPLARDVDMVAPLSLQVPPIAASQYIASCALHETSVVAVTRSRRRLTGCS